MNDCKTCKHYLRREGNDLCQRTRTWATTLTTDQPVWITMERNAGKWEQQHLRRLEGDVCGAKGAHWVQK